jgi:hypothetical protein
MMEMRQIPAENAGRGSSALALLRALKEFFKDNPAWE